MSKKNCLIISYEAEFEKMADGQKIIFKGYEYGIAQELAIEGLDDNLKKKCMNKIRELQIEGKVPYFYRDKNDIPPGDDYEPVDITTL